MPAWEELAPHYGEGYYTHGRGGTGGKRSYITRLRMRIAWSFDRGTPLNPQKAVQLLSPGASVCELGCGDGSFLAQLAAQGFAVVGVDPDPQACSTASKHVRVIRGSAEDLPRSLVLGSYDMAIMSHALEHCPDPITAMQNVYDLLTPGGFALLAVPNNESMGLRLSGPSWRWLDVPRHLNFFSAESLRRLCERSGLTVVSTHYDGYCRQFGEEWVSEERRIREEFGLPRRSPWPLLLRTLFASDPHKYDTVWLAARKGTKRERVR